MIRRITQRGVVLVVAILGSIPVCGMLVGFEKVSVWAILLGIASVPVVTALWLARPGAVQGDVSRLLVLSGAVGAAVLAGSFVAMMIDERLGLSSWQYVLKVSAVAGVLSAATLVVGGVLISTAVRWISRIGR